MKKRTLFFPKLGLSKIRFMAVFGIPTLILFIVFSIVPITKSIVVSFYEWSGFTPDMLFVGFNNYKTILTDPVFLKSIVNDFSIVLGKEFLIVVLSIFFAVSLTRLKLKKPKVSFFRFVFYFPNILSVIIIANIWAFIYNPKFGLLNWILDLIGLPGLASQDGWLVEYTIPAIIVVASWCGIGFYMIVLISAINEVPNDLYEASEIDGAGQMRQLRYITMPAIWQQIQFMVISILYGTLGANVSLIMPLTNGGPDNRSMVMGLYVYQKGITDGRLGYSYAASVCLMMICLTVSFLAKRMMDRKESE